jgi:hypothetical protein
MKRTIIDGIDHTPLPRYLRLWINAKVWWRFARRRPLNVWIWRWRHGMFP